jgi:hypothetical protein
MDKTYSLYYEGADKRLIADNIKDKEEVWPLIREFIRSVNPSYIVYYTRVWGINPVFYDVGSHTEFFVLYENK